MPAGNDSLIARMESRDWAASITALPSACETIYCIIIPELPCYQPISFPAAKKRESLSIWTPGAGGCRCPARRPDWPDCPRRDWLIRSVSSY